MAADPRSASLVTQQQTPTAPSGSGYGSSAKRPANPTLGYLYYDTTLGLEIVWVGTWKAVGVLPVPMVGFGTTSDRPVNPPAGFLYFDNTIQKQLTWNGQSWVLVSNDAVQMVGYGTSAQRPSSSPNGFLFFDTTLQIEHVWTGGGWLAIGPSAPPAPPAPSITSSGSASATTNTAFSYQITATNSPSSYGCTGSLPTGLSFNTTTGVLSGTPTVAGTFALTISATNGSGTGSAPLSVVVTAAALTPARFTRVIGTARVISNRPGIVGAVVESATASTLTFTLTDANGGQLAPGVSWYIAGPGTNNTLGSGTTNGGESSITASVAIATAGGYSVVVSSSSAMFMAKLQLDISGGALFANGSVRGTCYGPVISPPSGAPLTLVIQNIDPTTRIGFIEFTEGTTTVVRQAPYYTWNFNGDTTSNPKTNLGSVTTLTLVGAAGPSFVSDSRLECGP